MLQSLHLVTSGPGNFLSRDSGEEVLLQVYYDLPRPSCIPELCPPFASAHACKEMTGVEVYATMFLHWAVQLMIHQLTADVWPKFGLGDIQFSAVWEEFEAEHLILESLGIACQCPNFSC